MSVLNSIKFRLCMSSLTHVSAHFPAVCLGAGESKLQVQCIKGRADKVRELLAMGADPNLCDHAGWTPLHEVANYGHTESAQALLEAGYSWEPGNSGVYLLAAGDGGVTPLHDAAMNGNLGVAKLLVKAGGG